MSTGDTQAGAPVRLSAEVAKLAKDFQLYDGKMRMGKAAFLKWKAEHKGLAGREKLLRGQGLVALAVRFQREGGNAAAEAIGQLLVLAAGLLGQATAGAAFQAAGVGWTPKPKGPRGKGWGSK